MTRLKENLRKEYLATHQHSKSKKTFRVISVYVENEDDVPFWKDIFDKQNLKTKIYPASKTSLDRGKVEVLKLKDKTGEFLILCVDSDYDYLLQKKTEISKTIIENPFIFQTYTYSIENYKCYAESLYSVIVKATLQDKRELFDYNLFLEKYSSIIYDLFIYSFHNEKNKLDKFSIEDFSKIIKLLENVDFSTQGEKALEKLNKKVERKIKKLDELSEIQILNYQKELKKLGLIRENTYLFIKGHILNDNVVLMFLKPIEKYLRTERRKQINELKKDSEEAINRRNQYNKSIVNVDLVLRMNTNYYDCFLMRKIEKDIEKYKIKWQKMQANY